MSNLSQRIEDAVMDKFNRDKRKALAYLREKCTFYARKADSKYGTPFHRQWHAVYRAYSSAEFAIGYWLDCDEGLYDYLNDDDY